MQFSIDSILKLIGLVAVYYTTLDETRVQKEEKDFLFFDLTKEY